MAKTAKATKKQAKKVLAKKRTKAETSIVRRAKKKVLLKSKPGKAKAGRGGKSASVQIQSVAKFIKALVADGRYDDFIAAFEKSGATLKIDRGDIRLAKTFLPEPRRATGTEDMTAQFDDPNPGPNPFDCK